MPITAPGAFAHRAGVHTKAVLKNPRSYEVLAPADFGLMRSIDVGSRFTGRYAVGHRATVLGLRLSNDEVCHLTQALKERAECGSLNQEEVDAFIHSWWEEGSVCRAERSGAGIALREGNQEKGSVTWEP